MVTRRLPSASVNNILLDLHNSSHPTKPYSIIANYWLPIGPTYQSLSEVGTVLYFVGNSGVREDQLLIQIWRSGQNFSVSDFTFLHDDLT